MILLKTVLSSRVIYSTCIFFAVLSLASCGANIIKVEDTYEYPEAVNLFNRIGELKFLLDDETSFYNSSIQLIEYESRPCLSLLNKNSGRLYLYPITEDSVLQYEKIIEFEDPNNFGKVSSHRIHGDTIFAVHETTQIIGKYDFQGQLINYNKWSQRSLGFLMQGGVGSTFSPLYYVDDHLIISCFFLSPRNQLFARVKDGISETFLDPLDLYKRATWSPNYRMFYHTINDGDSLIISYSNSHDLYAFDLDNYRSVYKIPNSGSAFVGAIESIEKGEMKDFNSRNNHYLRQGSYGPIYFDKYRHVYYRFALEGILDVEQTQVKKTSLIVLDQDLNRIGEHNFHGDELNECMVFITREGLCIADWKLSKPNEDFLIFTVFDLIK